MKPSKELLTHADYTTVLKPLLSEGAFARNPKKLLFVSLHLVVVAGGYLFLKHAEFWFEWPLAALVIGHSIACLGFYAHDLSHKTIIGEGPILRIIETAIWMIVGVPATMWKRVHNATHHRESNTVRDPDRWFLESENSKSTRFYTYLFYPHKGGRRWNLLIGCHFLAYVARNVFAVIGPSGQKPDLVPAVPRYSPRELRSLWCELALMAGYQLLLFAFFGGDLCRFAWGSIIVYCITSTIVMTYIFTNHSINPLCEHTDPLVGTTSVQVPQFFDILHTNFSYHTEHHLFPGMDSSKYPELARLVTQHFPDRYNRIPLSEAWRRLWQTAGFLS